MYEEHWGLADKPFRNTPDPHYLYFSAQHEEALARMIYCILEGQGGMLLSGEIGCGKTLLSRILLDELDPDRFEAANIVHSNLNSEQLLREILRQFGVDASGQDKAKLLGLLGDCFRAHQQASRQTIIIIDEAQLTLDAMTLEEMRLLLNFQQDRKFSVTLLLLGQPEIRERVKSSPQLLQRLSVRYHLQPLSQADSIAYMNHRLKVCGASADIFTRQAEQLIAEHSGGIPRRINAIADMALLAGFGAHAPLIDEDIVRRVLDDLKK